MSTIFDKTVCLSVAFHAPGPTRTGSIDRVETEADKQELRLNKRIFDSENYRRVLQIRSTAKDWLKRRSVPSPLRNGTYLIPQVLLDRVDEYLDEMTVEHREAVDRFIEEYPSLIEQWRDKLKDQFNEADYHSTSEMRRRFGVNRMILNFSPARPDEIDQQKEIENAVDEIKAALRCGLLELVERMSGMLDDAKDGKKRRFSSKTLDAFREWMELFPARLVVDDDKLQKLAERAQKILEGKSVDDLRDLEKVRTQTRDGLEKIGTQLKKLVEDMPKRAFGFDDE